MKTRGSYYTTTKLVGSTDTYRSLAIDGPKFRELLANGETFKYQETFSNPMHEKYTFYPETVEVTLTCSVDKAMLKSRSKPYYYAHWRDNRLTTKTLKRKYLGLAENITLDKLRDVARAMIDQVS
jgi:hypothetical protein